MSILITYWTEKLFGFVPAAFFAVAEGHQEAVIWYAALSQLLVFTFVIASFILWVLWIQDRSCHAGYLVGFFLFLWQPCCRKNPPCVSSRYKLWRSALSTDAGAVIGSRSSRSVFCRSPICGGVPGKIHPPALQRWKTFALSAPFWLTLPHSIARTYLASVALAWVIGAAVFAARSSGNTARAPLLPTNWWSSPKKTQD
jgi:hypothetical protein